MKFLVLIMTLLGVATNSYAQHIGHSMPHEMQHGFVLAADDKFASHLVANGHHSRQTEIIGQLFIEDPQELEIYQNRKLQSAGNSYFVFQAQNLDLPTLSSGQVLRGHIIESKIGEYEPKNRIVISATFHLKKVLLNIPNPFFADVMQVTEPAQFQETDSNYVNELVNYNKIEKKHCCETGKKPCNWKC